MKRHPSVNSAWTEVLQQILVGGRPHAARGLATLDTEQGVAFAMRRPVLVCPVRRLSYTFLAAEALWILAGDESVRGIAPYNPNIAQFSDDGERFYGAYGPPVVSQLDYVVRTLRRDPGSRQAWLTIWRPNPPITRDVPCTIALGFRVVEGRLDAHAFMRSSDAWLGVPYDWFNFTMVACRVLSQLGSEVQLGTLHWTAASSHLYELNRERAQACLDWLYRHPGGELNLPELPGHVEDWSWLERSLVACRDQLGEPEGLTWRIRP